MLALLGTGRFIATDKYAVLLALLDLCAEQRHPGVLAAEEVPAYDLQQPDQETSGNGG